MSYQHKFSNIDILVNHFASITSAITDPEILANYAGIISVNGTTVFELAIKEIFINFASKKNKVFGAYVANHFERLNGRIKLSDLENIQIKSFGQKYLKKFKDILSQREQIILTSHKNSIMANYDNLIICRHNYIHKGNPTLTISEAINCYQFGKEIINCLFEAMKR